MYDNINYKTILKRNNIILVILMILTCSIIAEDMLIIIPSLLFIGIISGLMKNNTINEAIIVNIISFILGSVVSVIVSIISLYYSEGGLFAIAAIQYSWIYIVYYTFIGTVGSAIGYYIKDEIKNRG